MSTLQRLGKLEMEKAAEEFGQLVSFILRHRGDFSEAVRAAQSGKLVHMKGLTPRLAEVLKSYGGGREISQKSITTPNMLAGSAFADISVITEGFVNSLAANGVFDRMLPDMARIPLRSGTVGAVTVSATGYIVTEAYMKPISRLSVTGQAQNPQKAHVAIVITQELSRAADTQLIQRELRNAIVTATDAGFILNLISGVTTVASAGITPAAVRADIEYLLRQVPLGSNSRPYLICTPAMAETLSQMNNGGEPAFPLLGPLGGFISPGLPLLVSDGVITGQLILVDASMIAAASGEVILQQIEDGVVEMSDTPTSPPTASVTLQGLWQANMTGIRCERYWIGVKLRTDAVAVIQTTSSYSNAGSPPTP